MDVPVLITASAAVVLLAFCLGLTGFAVLSFARPAKVVGFLHSFASSARAHYTEQLARLLIGSALVVRAPEMWQPSAFRALGWLIVATAIALMLLPWRWHHRFAQWAIPMVIRHLRLYALVVLAFAGLLIYAMFFG